jgi:hypothetical protein
MWWWWLGEISWISDSRQCVSGHPGCKWGKHWGYEHSRRYKIPYLGSCILAVLTQYNLYLSTNMKCLIEGRLDSPFFGTCPVQHTPSAQTPTTTNTDAHQRWHLRLHMIQWLQLSVARTVWKLWVASWTGRYHQLLLCVKCIIVRKLAGNMWF